VERVVRTNVWVPDVLADAQGAESSAALAAAARTAAAFDGMRAMITISPC
jgi:hypothetical protein